MATQIRSVAAGACTNSNPSFLLFHHRHHHLLKEERRKKNAINVPPPPRLTAASSSSYSTTTTNWSLDGLRRLRTSSSRSAVRSSGDHVQRRQDAAIHHHHREGGGADHRDHRPISNPPFNPSSSSSTIRAPLRNPSSSSSTIRASLRNGHDHGDDTIDGADIDRVVRLVHLGALFASWYLFNIYFNIFNKQVLKVFPFPLTISAFQFGVGALLSLLLTLTRRRRTATTNRCNVSSAQLMSILPLAIAHTLGSLFTNMSLGMVAVSFTHTIKALEPFFTVALSALFLGEFPTIWVLSSLVPVVGGVALASLTEASFNWSGFWSAMASNLANQSRNVLSKKAMVKKEESLDNIALFSIITIMSFFMSVPIALFVEGINFTSFYVQSSSLNLREIYVLSILAALCFHGHQQVSYTILARVSPVSHSVGNCVKRVVVIVSSLLFFRAPVSPVNSLGTAIALAGVFLYSRVTSIRAQASRVQLGS